MDELEVYVVFDLVIFFLTNHKNIVPEPKTGHFRRLVGFEVKAKDLNCKAKAKDFKTCSLGRPRG